MPGTLYTYGATITGTAAYFQGFDTIAVSPDDPTGLVKLQLSEGGTVDLTSQLLGRPVDLRLLNPGGATTSNGNDSLHGSSGADVFYGGDGNDYINGGAGIDYIDGGDGDDSLTSGGTDNGPDTFIGGDGNDTIVDYWGPTTIDAGDGDDVIGLGSGVRSGIADGGAGIDTLGLDSSEGQRNIDQVTYVNIEILKLGTGGAIGTGAHFEQFDHIVTNSSTDTANLSLSAPGVVNLLDQLSGQKAKVVGTAGADDITTSDARDTIDGKDGDDILEGGAGADTLIGGAGNNTAAYRSAGSGVEVSLTTGKGTLGDAAGDTLTQIQNLIGSGFDDRLTGNAGVNRLEGGGGNDVLEGRAGADTLLGGDGIDTASYSASSAPVRVDLSLGTGLGGDAEGDTLSSIENLIGSRFADTLIGDNGDNVLAGGLGADVLAGQGGSDTASYASSAAAVRADLMSGTGTGGDAQGDTYFSIENVLGSAFDDTLIGNAQANRLDGGDGNDLLSGRGGPDALIGGNGEDTATYNASSMGVVVNLATGTGSGGDAQGDTLSQIENLIGSALADTLTGDDADNKLTGGLGADQLIGGGGSDTTIYSGSSAAVQVNLTTGAGLGGEAAGDTYASIENIVGSRFADTLTGDASDNVIEGGAGPDALLGEGGSDTASYASSSAAVRFDLTSGQASGGDAEGDTFSSIESVIGSGFSDTLIGDSHANTLNGGDGDDLLTGRAGADRLIGGGGIDTATYRESSGAVRVDLTNGTGTGGDAQGDTLSGVENITGSSLGDTLIGDFHSNTLNGGEGDDLLSGRAGADQIIGGGGIDTATFGASAAGVRVDLVAGTGTGGDAQGDTYSSIENITGSNFDDTLIGTVGVNRIDGGAGNDTISGRAGPDALIGGSGIDTASYGTSAQGVRVDLTNGIGIGGDADGDTLSGVESITGSKNADTLIGDINSNTLNGGDGNDLLSGRAGADTLIGGNGIDTSTYGASTSAVSVNLLTGTGTGGDAEGDTLSSVENLIGSTRGDTLIGNGVANRLAGGLGNDALTGNGGADTFVFDTAVGPTNIDTITDFTVDLDTIELSKSIYSALQSGATPGSLSNASFRYSSDPSTSGGLGEIIYNATTGSLSYDSDGMGAAAPQQIAQLSTFLAMSASQFKLV